MRTHLWAGAFLGAILGSLGESAWAQPANPRVLNIGATGTLTGKADGAKEKAGMDILHKFIKEETGLDNEIQGQLPWRDLAEKMAKGQFQLGVFQGYEFAWAREKDAELKPLSIGINGYRYPVASVLIRRDNPAGDFAALKGQSLAKPNGGQLFLDLFLLRQPGVGGKLEAYFSKVTPVDNLEDAFDDVVDGKLQCLLTDQAGIDAYKRRKPGRFNQLKEVARSEPFPPVVISYRGATLPPATLKRFKDGLLSAARKEKGELLLTLAHLSAFENVPADFDQMLAKTCKNYSSSPPSDNTSMK